MRALRGKGGKGIGRSEMGGQRIHVDAEKYKRRARSSHRWRCIRRGREFISLHYGFLVPLMRAELACSLIKEAQLDSTRCVGQLWEGIPPSYQSMVTDMTLHNHSTTHYLTDWHLHSSTSHFHPNSLHPHLTLPHLTSSILFRSRF